MPTQILVVEDTPENLELMTYLLKAFGHAALVARDGASGVALAREAQPDVVVMDLQMPLLGGLEAAAQLRSDPLTAGIPLVAVTAYAMVGDRDKILSAGFDGYIAKPIDPETFVQQVESFLPDPRTGPPGGAGDGGDLGRRAAAVGAADAAGAGPSEPADLSGAEDLTHRARRTLAERLGVIHAAALAAEEGTLDAEQRRDAARQAHRLAGAAASFGYPAATEPARVIESMLEGDDDVRPVPLAMSVRTLRSAMSVQASRSPSLADRESRLVITVVGDRAIADSLSGLVTRHQLVVRHIPAADPADGSADDAEVVVLDLATAGPASMAMLDRLAERSTSPAVLVLVAPEDDRVALAARGARGYHDRSIDARALLEECLRVVARDSAQQTVLVIDDDELITANVAATLEPAGFRVVASGEPDDLDALLDDVCPDLLVLNVDLGAVDGVQLCRRVRTSPRWAPLPVMFLTAARDAACIERMFRSGADDYVAKPVVGTELLVRVRNRLDRVQIHQQLADIDSVTGLPTRRRCEEGVRGLLASAERFDQPLTLALLDVDGLKVLNERHGHAVGDEVLRLLGAVLRDGLCGDDVVGRWSGDEFVVAMYGMTPADAARRLQAVHDEYRAQLRSLGPDVTSSFSTGVASHPDEAGNLDRLLTLAGGRLDQAKSRGPARSIAGGGADHLAVDAVIADGENATP